MHPCLSILDILGIIFEIIVEEPKSGPKTIFALVCTCSTFQETALNILWRTIPSFIPLIECLSPDAWEYVNDTNGLKVLSLKRPTILSDWARCKTYTPRIKRLGFGKNHLYDVKITGGVVAALEQYKVLPLPNLQAYHHEGTCSVGSLALGRKLLELEIVYDDASYSPGLVDSLETSSPLLQKFTISRSHVLSFELPDDFGSIVACLNQLETLCLVNLTLPDGALQILASSPTIRVLKSDNSPEDFLRCLPDSGPIFPELEEFSFYAWDLEECSDLIEHMAPRHLQSIVVVQDGDMPELDVDSFFESLKVNCDLAMLTSIRLKQQAEVNTPDFEESDWEYGLTTFKSLFAFQNLHTLCLHDLSIRYDFLDTDIKKMAAAWPLMRQFELTYDADINVDYEPILSLDGLLHIAKYWPQLEHLSLTFDAYVSGDVVTSNKPGDGNCCPLLTVFDVGYSSVSSSNAVIAAVLSDIFPNLGVIRSDTNCETWDDIMETVIVMEKVRKQEQTWAEQKFMRTR